MQGSYLSLLCYGPFGCTLRASTRLDTGESPNEMIVSELRQWKRGLQMDILAD